MEFSMEPMLSVRGGALAVEFYQRAFGATQSYRIEDPDGNVVARLSIGGAEFWVQDESSHVPSPATLGHSSVKLLLVVPDVDPVFAKAIAEGATDLGGVAEEHGWRTGRLADPFGHLWEIARISTAEVG